MTAEACGEDRRASRFGERHDGEAQLIRVSRHESLTDRRRVLNGEKQKTQNTTAPNYGFNMFLTPPDDYTAITPWKAPRKTTQKCIITQYCKFLCKSSQL